MPETHELQRLILPDLEVCQELRLYAHCIRNAGYCYGDRELRLTAGGCVSFASYFGAFSIGKWRRLTDLSRLSLRLELEGEGEVAVWNWRAGHDRRLLAMAPFSGTSPVEISIPVGSDADGIIAPRVTAWGPTRVREGVWLTSDPPRRQVRLGVVITTFRREAAVRATVQRLRRGLISDSGVDAALTVVDNGRTLTEQDVPGAMLIPNPNLGGSGGFARGLVWLQDEGSFTHAVFMDDDASAEIESVRRAIRLLGYVGDGGTAVVSALLYEERPGIQLEAAGQMPSDAWMPARPGVDLRKVESLVENELPFPVDYGGWWMFFFSLSGVRLLPFPFFVRGDDVEFPRANGFPLATLNGIASFGPDFHRKESPVNIALDRRGNLVNVLLHGSLKTGYLAVLRGLQKSLMLANRYCYDHVDAIIEGTRDVLSGPESFEDLIGFPQGRRRELAACIRQPRLAPGQLPDYPLAPPRAYGRLWHAARLLLANGHLVPRFLLLRRPVILGTVWNAPGAQVFLRPHVLVREGLDGTAVLAERDSLRYFGSLGRVAWISLRLMLVLPRVRDDFRRARPRFGSRTWWDSQFRGETDHRVD
jgi:GT2 family glycosyltransferase